MMDVVVMKFEKCYSYGNPFAFHLYLLKIEYVWKVKGNLVSEMDESSKGNQLVEVKFSSSRNTSVGDFKSKVP